VLKRVATSITIAAALCAIGCQPSMYVPDQATRPYPRDLHTTETRDIQVFRNGTELEIVNSTATSWSDFDLWLNQRYVAHIEELPAGQTVRVSLWRFIDERGERFNAGGLLRTTEPEPVRLVQIQPDGQSPLVGLIMVPSVQVREF